MGGSPGVGRKGVQNRDPRIPEGLTIDWGTENYKVEVS